MDKRDGLGFLANRGVQIGIAVGVAAVSAFLIASYVSYQKDEAPSQPQTRNGQPVNPGVSAGRQYPQGTAQSPVQQQALPKASQDPRYKALAINLRTMIQRELQSTGSLTERTIMGINEGLVLVAQKDFADSIVKNRSARRAVSDQNMPQYIDIVRSGTVEIEEILMVKLNEVLTDVGCTQEQYETSNQEIAARNPNFAFMSLMLIERMKSSIQSGSNVSKVDLEKAREIMQFQIDTYPTIQIDCPDPQLLPLIKQSWLGDLTYKRFGIEDEDLVKVPGIKMDQKFRELAMELQSVVQKDAMGGGFF